MENVFDLPQTAPTFKGKGGSEPKIDKKFHLTTFKKIITKNLLS